MAVLENEYKFEIGSIFIGLFYHSQQNQESMVENVHTRFKLGMGQSELALLQPRLNS